MGTKPRIIQEQTVALYPIETAAACLSTENELTDATNKCDHLTRPSGNPTSHA